MYSCVGLCRKSATGACLVFKSGFICVSVVRTRLAVCSRHLPGQHRCPCPAVLVNNMTVVCEGGRKGQLLLAGSSVESSLGPCPLNLPDIACLAMWLVPWRGPGRGVKRWPHPGSLLLIKFNSLHQANHSKLTSSFQQCRAVIAGFRCDIRCDKVSLIAICFHEQH